MLFFLNFSRGGGGLLLIFFFQIDGFSFKVDFYFLKKGDSVSTYL